MHHFSNQTCNPLAGLPFFLLMLSCAQLQVKDGVLSPPHKNYTVNIPGKGWEMIKVGKDDIALWHKQHHAMIRLYLQQHRKQGAFLRNAE